MKEMVLQTLITARHKEKHSFSHFKEQSETLESIFFGFGFGFRSEMIKIQLA